jgi:hypothetical protein
LGTDYTQTLEISQEQYDAMMVFGQNPAAFGFNMYYNGLFNSCIDFVWKALNVGGLNPSNYEGTLWPTDNRFRRHFITPDPFFNPSGKVPDGVASSYLQSRTWVEHRDPLTLDLDGDGIETTGINGYANTVLFDHDGDGVKTGTGWVKGDDAFLALDRNGNGMIDNGSELFGIDTVMSNGQNAANGFAALADLDSNGNGQFDSADAQFANVRLWRDLDQDGVSDEGELLTLEEAGVASINLSNVTTHTNLAGGNV